jgi:putative membrane protein
MTPEIQAFSTGFPATLAHAAVALILLGAGSALYALVSPNREIQEIRDGNAAAAVSFGGVMLGLAVPLAFSLSASTSIDELGLWGVAIVAVQLLLFRVVDFILKGLPHRVQEGEISAAIVLVSARVACALLLAAAVAG